MCKKLLTLFLSFSICMLAGCGGDAEEETKDTGGKPSDTPATAGKYEKYDKMAESGISAQTRVAALLKQVKDADSAKAVAPMIKEASGKWREAMGGLDGLMKAAPEAEQKEIDKHLDEKFGKRLGTTVKDFNAQVERIKAVPELSKIIMPALSGE